MKDIFMECGFQTKEEKEMITMKLSNKNYDLLKKIALYIAPIATFVGAICAIWGVPSAEKITATLAALDTLIGALVAISSYNYNKPADVDVTGLVYLEDEKIKGVEVNE